jgi:hypothetical protein
MLSQEVLDRLKTYVEGDVSLEDFEAWFVPATLEVHRSPDQDAQELTATINLWLAEFSNGDRTEAEIRELFGGLLPRIRLQPRDWLVPTPTSSGSGILSGTRYPGALPPIWVPRIDPVAA